ncbi:MAG: FtsW/RodA/SpoVE family cell cycle protein [Clostridiales bacterium]|nr:FtsW/RodA/SpoVE family cell cycle protein [Clostridiales bacterium]
MAQTWTIVKRYLKNGDTLLLLLCVTASIFGIILISSASRPLGNPNRYIAVQSVSLVLGIIMFIVFSMIDLDLLCDRWKLLLLFNILAIASLLVFGEESSTGNKSWISFSWMPVAIQPAEIVKLTFTLLLARQMYAYRERINAPSSVARLLLHLLLMLALIMLCSQDAGMAFVYAVMFAFMAFAAGISLPWILAGLTAIAAVTPLVWNSPLMSDYQKDRILVILDPSIDPDNLNAGWQAAQSKLAIGSGQLFGQGLYNGKLTQSGSIFAMHNDFIFACAGEEFGILGCLAIIAVLTGIIACCLVRAVKCKRPMSALICAGFAGMLTFQTFENIGMCLGITPVIGLTLPFISYGGSSLVATFCCMGIVSGIRLRPPPIVTRY